MNKKGRSISGFSFFLNGVCRHELPLVVYKNNIHFLNGVCRHELILNGASKIATFLNGVCRHELLTLHCIR